jgi:tetratricopeptide (TPR) repeat protein
MPLYEAQRDKVLQHTPPNFWKYGTIQIHGKEEEDQAISAFTTWEMSFQQLRSNDPRQRAAASHFLTLSMFFDPANIGESIFRSYWEEQLDASRPDWMEVFVATDEASSRGESMMTGSDTTGKDTGDGEAVHASADARTKSFWDAERFWSLLNKAHELSLLESVSIEMGGREVNFFLHPLIRDWLQLRGKAPQRHLCACEAIYFVVSSIRTYESELTTLYQKKLLMAHMNAFILNDERFSVNEHRLGEDTQNNTAAAWFVSFYKSQGRYEISEKLKRLNLETSQRELGFEHPNTLTSMNNLANMLSNRGKYEEAKEMHQQELAICEKVLRKEHPDTLMSINNLANVLSNQGKYKEAEEMHRRALRLRETVLGKEHPYTLTSMDDLANPLSNQGKYKEVEETYGRTLKLKETVLGKEHPDTLTSMNNLA